jgi:hypothetical protein
MSLAEKAIALLTVLRAEDVKTLPMAKRQHFADLCRHLADLAEIKAPPPKVGVLSELHRGERGHQ